MPTQASLGSSISSAAATAKSDVKSQILAAINALEAWIFAKGRSYIDTPEERQAIEAEAVKVFTSLFADELGPAGSAIVAGFVSSVLDKLLTYLAATPVIPAPTPDPVPQPKPAVGAAP